MKKKFMAVALGVGIIGLSGCSQLDSIMKTHESNTKGLHRTIEVFSVTGKLLKTYEGESVRVETENENGKTSVLVDGKRFSFNNAIVIIEEK